MRILFSASPALGHIIPLLPPARALRVRGNAVAFLVDESVASSLKEEGIESFPAGPASNSSSSRCCVQPAAL
jgi:UDP:flavonoid glycosyltransferase YjiC (YdhE family)